MPLQLGTLLPRCYKQLRRYEDSVAVKAPVLNQGCCLLFVVSVAAVAPLVSLSAPVLLPLLLLLLLMIIQVLR
jgi:hypothetical protein